MSAAEVKTIISAEDIGICYRRRRGFLKKKAEKWVLKNVSFTLNSGDTLGVIGKNGAGKSTLMRLLAGIIAPDTGRITVRDNTKIALLGLNGGIYPYLTGAQNIVIGGVLLGFSEREVLSKFDEIVEFSALGKVLSEPVNTYSSGMKSRLVFSIGAILKTDVLLLDEVLSVGDKDFKKKSEALMRSRILSDQTVVYISHNEKSVRELCNRVIWLDEGRIRMDGDPDQVIAAYLE